MESWGRVWVPDPSGFEQRMSAPHGSMLMSVGEVRKLGGFNEAYRIAGDYDLVSRILTKMSARLLWQTAKPLAFCSGDGVSVRNYLEAFLEESLIRLRVWGKTQKEVGLGIGRYYQHAFQYLLRREESQKDR